MLTRADTEQIAHLARLSLTEGEIEQFAADLTSILDHMAALAEVDTTGVEPMTHAVPITLRLRDDRPQPSLSVEAALADAPAVRDHCFEVPAIISGKGGS